jgi:hypothetical protein
MPGFQALVAGRGAQIVITQAMLDQANDIATAWPPPTAQRWATP